VFRFYTSATSPVSCELISRQCDFISLSGSELEDIGSRTNRGPQGTGNAFAYKEL
jgi:hypothetical protein